MTFERVIELLLGNLGVLVLLLVILVGGFRGWWVYGWYARELRSRNEKLEDRLERAGKVVETGTGLATRAAQLAEERQTGVPGE